MAKPLHPFFKGKALGTRLIAVLLRTGAITKWCNTKDWKDAEQYSNHNTKANQQWLLQPLFQCLRFEPPPRPNYKKKKKSGALLLVIQRKEVKKKIHRSAYDDNVLLRWKRAIFITTNLIRGIKMKRRKKSTLDTLVPARANLITGLLVTGHPEDTSSTSNIILFAHFIVL